MNPFRMAPWTRRLPVLLLAVVALVGCKSVSIKEARIESVKDGTFRLLVRVDRDLEALDAKGWYPRVEIRDLLPGEGADVLDIEYYPTAHMTGYFVSRVGSRKPGPEAECLASGDEDFLYAITFPLKGRGNGRYEEHTYCKGEVYDLTTPGVHRMYICIRGSIKAGPGLKCRKRALLEYVP